MRPSPFINFFNQLLAVFVKELHLLRRDRGGLAVLFIMPVALVLIVCLVQDNILKVSGATTIKMVLVDHDQGSIGQAIIEQLNETGSFELSVFDEKMSFEQVKQSVSTGVWQAGVYLSAGMSEQLKRAVDEQVKASLRAEPLAAPLTTVSAQYFFDPAVQGGLQAGIRGVLTQLVSQETLKLKMASFQTLLPKQIERYVSTELGPMFGQVLAQKPFAIQFPEQESHLLQAVQINAKAVVITPTSIQHNIPAWSLFGIFFIILPLSGVILQERSQGVFTRLLLIPGQHFGVLLGRLFAYLALNMVQFSLMLMIGFYILPLLGTDTLQLNGQGLSYFIVAFCSGLAACGFGLLLGIVARSPQQAIMTAAVAIVISAALGGIMVPVYMMPTLMQSLSVVSPLGWGLEAFQILLLRGGTLHDIVPQLLSLLICFFLCVFISWRKLRHLK